MNLQDKKYFYFTQNSLNTFRNCPFQFKKKYIDNVKWQQDSKLDAEEKIEFGNDFHETAQRYFSEIPVFEEGLKSDEKLYNAYCNLKDYFPLDSKNKYYPEYTIRYSDGVIRLEANFDLVIVTSNGEVEIWDWKTNSSPDKAERYLESLQTRVYRYVLKKCMKEIFGFDTDYDKIKMSYFSPENKCVIVDSVYSEEAYKKDEKDIVNLIKKIYNYDYDAFERENYLKHCKLCEFQLFCDNQPEDKEEKKHFVWNEIDEIR